MSIKELKDLFPLTCPIPNPLTHPQIINTSDLTIEEDLSKNPTNIRSWFTYIDIVKSRLELLPPIEDDESVDQQSKELLGPLATNERRSNYQLLTSIYERALIFFPFSYRLWHAYLVMKLSFLSGHIDPSQVGQTKRARRKATKGQPIVDLDNGDERIQWDDLSEGLYLDGFVGEREWKSVAAVFERALTFLPNVSLFIQITFLKYSTKLILLFRCLVFGFFTFLY